MQEEAIRLFNKLEAKFGRSAVLKYIEARTEIVPSVVLDWITRKPGVSSNVQKPILICLRNARNEDFPAVPPPVPLAVKPQVEPPAQLSSERSQPKQASSKKKPVARHPLRRSNRGFIAQRARIRENEELLRSIQEELCRKKVVEQESEGVG